jgi:hypothetical protein
VAVSLFDQGVENMKAQNYEVGCKQIAESVRLDRRPGSLYTLARCEADWGHVATAVARYDDYLQFCQKLSGVDKDKQAARMSDAKKRRDELAPDVPHWTITLAANAPPNTEVKRDGESVGKTLLGVRHPIDPGVHVLSTQAPGGPVTEKRIEILKGADNRVVLDVALAQPVGQPSIRRSVGWGFVGVGGAILGGGLIAGATVFAKKDVVDKNCGAAIARPDMPTVCNDPGRDALESANTAATVANIGVIGGAAGVVMGLILVATAPKPSLPPKTGLVPDVKVDLWPSPFGGVMAGFRGKW